VPEQPSHGEALKDDADTSWHVCHPKGPADQSAPRHRVMASEITGGYLPAPAVGGCSESLKSNNIQQQVGVPGPSQSD
jgi:hypothetical protein